MATSGSENFSMTRNDVCIASLRLAGVVSPEQAIANSTLSYTTTQLNMLIKHLQNMGAHLWTRKHATVFLNVGQYVYTLGTGGDKASDDARQTALNAAGAINATTLTLTS